MVTLIEDGHGTTMLTGAPGTKIYMCASVGLPPEAPKPNFAKRHSFALRFGNLLGATIIAGLGISTATHTVLGHRAVPGEQRRYQADAACRQVIAAHPSGRVAVSMLTASETRACRVTTLDDISTATREYSGSAAAVSDIIVPLPSEATTYSWQREDAQIIQADQADVSSDALSNFEGLAGGLTAVVLTRIALDERSRYIRNHQ